jgi:hypothetical protein
LQVLVVEAEEGGFLGWDPADDDDSGAAGMGIAAPPSQTTTTYVSQPTKTTATAIPAARPASSNSMSDFHQGSSGVFDFSHGFDRPDTSNHLDQQQQNQDPHQHVAQQSRREKLRVQQQQGFEHGQLLPIEPGAGAMYDHHAAATGATNMLSDMFNIPAPPSGTSSATELLASQITAANYRFGIRPGAAGLSGDGGWFGAAGQRAGGLVLGGAGMGGSLGETSSPKQQQGGMGGIATDPASAMQLFLMNPQQSRASPPPSDAIQQHHEAFQAFGAAAPFGGGVVEGQGLSLSLSPSLQQQAEELRVRDGVLYFNNNRQQQQVPMALQGQVGGALGQHQLHVGEGYGPAAVAGVLRNSKYSRAAQELLEEFCSVGRGGQVKGGGRGERGASSSANPNNKGGGAASNSGAAQSPSSAASKEPPQLSPADRFEHQRKKAKLISMLDEARSPPYYCCFHTQNPLSFSLACMDGWCMCC